MDEKRGIAPQVAVGVVLIVFGALMLVARYLEAEPALWARAILDSVAWDVVWPFFVLGFGTFLLGLGLVDERLAVSLVPGSMVLTTGLLLLMQNSLGIWQTWVYAWTLVVPTSVGIGLWLWGLRAGSPRLRRAGRVTTLTGLIMFGVFAISMEGLFGIGVLESYGLRTYLFPVLLILGGLLLMIPWRRRRPRAETGTAAYEPPRPTVRWPEQGETSGIQDTGQEESG